LPSLEINISSDLSSGYELLKVFSQLKEVNQEKKQISIIGFIRVKAIKKIDNELGMLIITLPPKVYLLNLFSPRFPDLYSIN